MSKKYYVYELHNPITDKVFYVGKSSFGTIPSRKRQHISESKSAGLGKRYRTYKNNTILKILNSGEDIIENIVFETDVEQEAFDKEIELIAFYGRKNTNTGILTNLTDGGEGFSGVVVSDEERQKMSERNSGAGNPMYGMSGEKCPMFNKQHSLEAKLKIANNNTRTDFKHTAEYKQSLRDAEVTIGDLTSRPVYGINKNGEIVHTFDSSKAASRQFSHSYKKSSGTVINEVAFSKKEVTAYGLFWRFVDDYDENEDFVKLELLRYKKGIGRPVIQSCATTGKTVKIWQSIKSINAEMKISDFILRKYIKSGEPLDGFIWSKSYVTFDRPPKLDKRIGRSILQYDLQNTFIKEWKSIGDIEKDGYSRSSVKASIYANRPRLGYYWRYKI